jgi:hypothetical protein
VHLKSAVSKLAKRVNAIYWVGALHAEADFYAPAESLSQITSWRRFLRSESCPGRAADGGETSGECFANTFHGFADVFEAVEGADSDIALTAGAESRAGGYDHSSLVQQTIKEFP